MNKFSKSIELGNRTLSLETGGFAGQANAAVMGRYGDTMVLVTVVSAKAREDLGYFPLDVEYVERLYAGGRIKGSRWVKREGRPSDEAILKGRLIDRSIRPLFPSDYFNEVQVAITILSVDLENDPEVLSIIATSAALAISNIPWDGPIGAIRVGLKEGSYFTNPGPSEIEYSDLNLIISATNKAILMIEGNGKQVLEKDVEGAIDYGKNECQKIIQLIEEFAKEVGQKKESYNKKVVDASLKKDVDKLVQNSLDDLIRLQKEKGGYEEVKLAILEHFEEQQKEEAIKILEEIVKEEARKRLLEGKRPDGRKIDEIRPLETGISILPRTHGSALFSRGETQVLTVTTLGSPSLQQLIESAEGEESKRFIHHYSMPPYSSGEVGRFGTPSRREIGHGALAERALEPVIPSEDKFPYTIRLVSEVLSSNGSTSMASTCGSTLSLMDAGVPIIAPVAGIAMGLVTDKDKHVVLTDIAGIEDHFGEMDFKVAGTVNGITAIQMDVKNLGIDKGIVNETLERAKQARIFILKKMGECIASPRAKISQYAPKVVILRVPVDKIGEVIGPGGRTIRKIIEDTGCTVEVEDDGSVSISGTTEESVEKATKVVEGLTHEVKPGEEFDGIVKRVQPFGAFVEIIPGKEGLVHVSQMSTAFVSDPNQIVTLGQTVKVRVMEIDELKRINLTMLSLEDEKKQREQRKFSPIQNQQSRPRQSFDRRRPHW